MTCRPDLSSNNIVLVSTSGSISEKRADYMVRWSGASVEQMAELTLLPTDGI